MEARRYDHRSFTTAIIGAYRGYQVISIELEPPFHELAMINVQINRSKIAYLKNPLPTLLCGDSRKLGEILGIQGALTSPPFLQSGGGRGGINVNGYGEDGKDKVGDRTYQAEKGDRQEGNIEILPEGDYHQVIGAVTSPPYSDARIGTSSGAEQVGHNENYGDTEGQLGSLPDGDHKAVIGAVTSPPYANRDVGTRFTAGVHFDVDPYDVAKEKYDRQRAENPRRFGDSPGQLGNLPEGDPAEIVGAITSPPWEDNLSADRVNPDQRRILARQMGESNAEYISPIDMEAIHGREQKYAKYGESPGQLGILSGDTYWSAVAIVYQQIYNLLPKGGAFALVVKDYVKNRERVPLCDQTVEILQAIGFDVPERIRATLVKHIRRPIDMFTGELTPEITIEHKSFFRRLAERKGSPRIDWEEVIWAVKP